MSPCAIRKRLPRCGRLVASTTTTLPSLARSPGWPGRRRTARSGRREVEREPRLRRSGGGSASPGFPRGDAGGVLEAVVGDQLRARRGREGCRSGSGCGAGRNEIVIGRFAVGCTMPSSAAAERFLVGEGAQLLALGGRSRTPGDSASTTTSINGASVVGYRSSSPAAGSRPPAARAALAESLFFSRIELCVSAAALEHHLPSTFLMHLVLVNN